MKPGQLPISCAARSQRRLPPRNSEWRTEWSLGPWLRRTAYPHSGYNNFSEQPEISEQPPSASPALGGRSMSILQVFNRLNEIACVSGKGSQQQKCFLLAQLLRSASSLEARYIVRTILGSHRIGVAEMTFLRALAEAHTGRPEDKETLEAAYSVLSDLGEVSFRLVRSGLAALKRVVPVLGTPVRMMLASRVQDLDELRSHMRGDKVVEYKYDGERVQIHVDGKGLIHAFSRRLERITHQYPELIEAVKKARIPKNTIVEGEVVAFDFKTNHLLPFQTLMQRRRKHDIQIFIKKVPAALFVFDILLVKNRSLLGQPLSKRRGALSSYVKESRLIRLSRHIITSDMSKVEAYFRKALAYGAEGVVIKSADSPYQAGKRGWFWIKFKKEYQKQLADTFDLVVVGAMHGKGHRAGSYGSLLLSSFDPATNTYPSLTKVGAGFTEQTLLSLPNSLRPYLVRDKHRLVDTRMKADVWFEPAKVIEVSGANLTISPVHMAAHRLVKRGGLALRFPRFVRFPNDKTAEQATTVQEIYDMYRSSTRNSARK
jgi:DNA ligase-1